MAGAVAARAVTALVLNKVVALFYGPMGITLLANLQNLLSIVVQIPNDGVNRGTINIFQFAAPEEKYVILKKVLLYNFLLTIITTSLILIAHEYFWEKFYPVTAGISLPLVFTLTIFFIVGFYTLISVFQADRRYFRYAVITAISSFLLLSTGAITAFFFELKHFLSIYLIGQALAFVVVFLFFTKDYSYLKKIKLSKSQLDISKPILQFIIMAVSVWLFSFILDFIVRNYAISTFGYEATGQWQAVVKLSDQLKSVFIATAGAVFFTEISARISDSLSLKKYISKTLTIILPLIFIALLTIYLLRIPILTILYSSDFIPSEKFMLYQLAGDFFAMSSYFFIYIIMAQRKAITFITFQAVSGAAYLFLIYFLIPFYGLEAMVMAHFIRYILFLVLVVFYSRRLMTHE